ncbi:MAG TPA: hypothetical protein VFR41_03890, partial [Acidimicrobiia bacterium]|nr:hypothetical protein [Acidimicrobiia bacterium]
QHPGCGQMQWRLPRRTLAFDDSPGSPWLVVPPEVRASFELLREAGVPLADGPAGRPHLGVKSGFNLAFLVTCGALHRDDTVEIVAANGRAARIERSLLRPVLRGEAIRAWRASAPNEYIVWTHGPAGRPLDRLPPLAGRWLAGWRRQLMTRSDTHGARWWSLFRVDAARCDLPRVIWADLGRSPRALVVPAGDSVVPLNSCYALLCREHDDALALAAVLNSPIAEAWLAALAEPARGGYRRFLGWTMALLPVPRDWERARRLVAPLALDTIASNEPAASRDVLLEAVLEAFHLRHRELAPLLTWFSG